MNHATSIMERAPSARESWIETHRSRLVRIAQSILHDEDEAEDVVQDTLLRAWRRGSTHDIDNWGGYVSRAVYWNALKRRARRRSNVSMDGDTARGLAGKATDGEEQRLSPLELERAIAELPLPQQTVVRLRFYVGLSFREVGQALSISANTAASRTRYALQKLRRSLGVGER
jgi:RNA polymerase sigma-70 factor (ECF subfamily)